MISKEEALRLVKKTSKYSHSLLVSGIIRELAKKLGEDEKKWEIVGLLHDLDYDQVKDCMSKHGIVASTILEGKLPEDYQYAIKSHDYRTDFEPKSKLDKGLIIADSLAIIIEKVKESGELSLGNVIEEIERISDEKPWIKDNILKCEEIGLSLNQLLKLCARIMEF